MRPSGETTNTQLPPVVVVEGAVGDQPRLRRRAERQPDLDGLAALQLGRLGADELEVDLERAVADLRIDLADPHPVGAAVHLGVGDLVLGDPAEVEFVDLGAQFVAAGAVDLAEPLAALQRLADLDRRRR